MAMDYLNDLEHAIDNGSVLYACPSAHSNEWIISKSVDELRPKAQRAANMKKIDTSIFRLINRMDVGEGDCFLVVRKILEPGPKGEPHLHWTVVDTREAAEMLRDVSQGPSPYFGATIEETFKPA